MGRSTAGMKVNVAVPSRRGARRTERDVPVAATSRQGRRRNRREEVALAAVEVFWRKGYPAASIQDVASEVGVLKGSLYHYIASKEELLAAVIDRVHEHSRTILKEVLALDLPPLERLRIYIQEHALWYLHNPKEVTVFMREWRHLTGPRQEQAQRRRRGYYRAMRSMIIAAQRDGALRPGVNPKYASQYVLAALNTIPDWYHPDGMDPPERIAAAYADMTIGMLRGAGDRPDRVP